MSDTYEDLIGRARQLGYTPEAVALLEEAVRLADAGGNLIERFRARSILVDTAAFAGAAEKGLVAFSWMLAQADADPKLFLGHHLFWQYKWILEAAPRFPQIPRRRVLDMLDDYQQRLTRHGYSLRSAHSLRLQAAMTMGDLDEADRCLSLWLKVRRDALADCTACELNTHVELLALLERDEQAVKKAGPILQGRMTCGEIPHKTYGVLERPLIRLGRLDEARSYYQAGYRLVSKNRQFVNILAEHLMFLVCADDYRSAVRVFQKHIGWAAETADLQGRFRFYLASSLLWSKAARARKRSSRSAASLPAPMREAGRDPAALAAWLSEQTSLLADRFDQRNENHYYSQAIEKAQRLAGEA